MPQAKTAAREAAHNFVMSVGCFRGTGNCLLETKKCECRADLISFMNAQRAAVWREAERGFIELAADLHRAKWQFDGENSEAFRVLDQLGEKVKALAAKAKEESDV